jgi:hypothetical protein
MRNIIKGLAIVGLMSLMSCKNEKPTSNSVDIASTPTTNTAAASVGSAAASATDAATQNALAGPRVAPDPNKVTPDATSEKSGKTTTIKFDDATYDWGKMKEGDKMTHIFKFKNTGENDLIISDARGSCGCTVPEWPKEPIKAGKNGEIKVVFDSAHKNGPQSKTVTITANTEPSSVTLMIKGIVEAKEEATK